MEKKIFALPSDRYWL